MPIEIFRGRILSTEDLAAIRREIESFDAIEVRISSSIVLIKSAEHVFGDLAATSEAQPLALQLNVIVAQFVTSCVLRFVAAFPSASETVAHLVNIYGRIMPTKASFPQLWVLGTSISLVPISAEPDRPAAGVFQCLFFEDAVRQLEALSLLWARVERCTGA